MGDSQNITNVSTNVAESNAAKYFASNIPSNNATNDTNIALVTLSVNNQNEISDIKTRLEQIEKEQRANLKLKKSLTKFSKSANIIVWVLLLIPIIQVLACALVVYILGIQDKLPSSLTVLLTIISGLSVLEIIGFVVKFYKTDSKIDELQDKIDKLEKE